MSIRGRIYSSIDGDCVSHRCFGYWYYEDGEMDVVYTMLHILEGRYFHEIKT